MLNLRTSRSTKDGKSFIRLHTSNQLEVEKMTTEVQDLETELKELQENTKQLEETLKKNQNLLVKKEQANKRNLIEIENCILGRSTCIIPSAPIPNIEKIHDYHSEIQIKLGIVQYKTLQILIEQEKDLVQEYKSLFISEAEKRAELKKQLKSKPTEMSENMRNLQKYKKRIRKFELLDEENRKLTQKNLELKLDRAEQNKEIVAMRFKLDELSLEKIKLEKIRENSRSFCRFPSIKSQSQRVLVVGKDLRVLNIDKLKQQIEEYKKDNKEERLKLFRIQESSNEIKFILKKTLQDISECIEQKGGKSSGKCSELVEKENITNKIYEKAFPVRISDSTKLLGRERPQMNDIESTMQQIQSMYENYEKDMKKKLA